MSEKKGRDPYDTTLRRRPFAATFGKVPSPGSRERLMGGMLGCKTGATICAQACPRLAARQQDRNNGKDAFGDIAATWTARDHPVLICGTPGWCADSSASKVSLRRSGRFKGMHVSSVAGGGRDLLSRSSVRAPPSYQTRQDFSGYMGLPLAH